ncbi:Hsp20/alpha crystallin family protein [Gracilibacillus marinus]|jgi:HSP20 family protein|uniref:Hsp20/alpha crystallin family protein n=1 Tax=Gracilibacillus marinus TaxID=630535 RepID=A0ABV8VZF9_9BACI
MDPFRQMHEWKNNLDHFFGGDFWNDFEHIVKPPIPAVNLYEQENEFILYINLPGIKDRKQINLSTSPTTVELKGQLLPIEQHGKIINQEILLGEFQRKIDLPFPIREDKVSASIKSGVMIVHLPKQKKEHNRKKISIETFEE